MIRRMRQPGLRTAPRTRRGIALLDVIIGTIILAIGLSVVISIASRSLMAQNDGERRLVAGWLADEMLSMVMVEGADRFPARHDTAGRFAEPFEQYRYEVDITSLGTDEFATYRVTTLIAWDGPQGERSVRVQTVLAPRHEDPDDELREPPEPLDRDQRQYERRYGDDAF